MSSSFVIIVISLEFIKRHQVISSNKLLIPLCFSATCFSIMLATNNIIGLVSPEKSQLGYVIFIFYILNMYSISSCSWLTSCLCFFYFIKIANFRSGCLAWTKMKIDSIVLWMLVVVEVLSLCGPLINSLIFVFSAETTMSSSSMINNMTESMEKTSKYLNVIFIVNIVPFIVVMITTALTIVSLNLHVRKMGKKISSTASLEVHRRVVWTMIQLLIVYSVFYLILFLFFFSTFTQMGLENWLYLILMSLFSPIQSAILIHSNPKFMKTWKTLYKSASCMKCHSG
ncbi:PREDICTED: taste receptor type 2 member 8-like [Nanorana parkeri]|uniref:taste receptor type 2 member 8-like n=1 Tax=Nanorana parkeri TaxID=125878 RepID=UPI000854A16A|nr:PREDICTED: taste receptor type 2 member 8-like [Nanorana parkeri]